MTAEEMSELMYKPLPGEWGERSREEECDRIIAGIDRLITVGVCAWSRSAYPLITPSCSQYSPVSPNSPGPRVSCLQTSLLPSLVPWTWSSIPPTAL